MKCVMIRMMFQISEMKCEMIKIMNEVIERMKMMMTMMMEVIEMNVSLDDNSSAQTADDTYLALG